MASFNKLPSGKWRAMVRKQGHRLSNTFRLKAEAEAWAVEQESRIGRGEKPSTKPITSRETLGDLIDLHLEDLKELCRGIGRSKEHTLFRLKDTIGGTRLSNIDREFLVNFAKRRAKQGAGPVTISIDISFMGTVMEHAAAVHGIAVPTEQIRLGRIALNRLGLIAKSAERDRRPTTEELDLIIKTAETNPRQIIPLGRIIKCKPPVATALPV